MKRIGILGGTFNPVHIGHLAMAQMAREKFDLKKVIFIPSNYPPHKKIKNLASAQDRFRMVRLAIKDNPFFEISDFEIKKEGKSYAIDTVRHLRKVYPKGTRLFFIIGQDSFPTLNTWKDIDEILKIVSFIVVNRPGCGARNVKIKHHPMIMPEIDISSSYCRRRIMDGRSVRYFVPERVFRYIERHRVYKK